MYSLETGNFIDASRLRIRHAMDSCGSEKEAQAALESLVDSYVFDSVPKETDTALCDRFMAQEDWEPVRAFERVILECYGIDIDYYQIVKYAMAQVLEQRILNDMPKMVQEFYGEEEDRKEA